MNHPGKNALTKTAMIKFGDIAGMTASVLCLLHCLAMPLVILAFPMLGLAHAHDTFHDTGKRRDAEKDLAARKDEHDQLDEPTRRAALGVVARRAASRSPAQARPSRQRGVAPAAAPR